MFTSANKPAKLGLDARAAELKQKLLKSRARNQSRGSTAPPESLTTNSPKESTSLATASVSSSTPSLDGGPSSSTPFIPHEAPQEPSAGTLPVDASDIAALIASLSTPNEIPGLGIINTPNGDARIPQTQQTSTADEPPSLPQNPPLKTIAPIQPSPGLAEVAATSHAKQVKEADVAVKTTIDLLPKEENPHKNNASEGCQSGGQPLLDIERVSSETAALKTTANENTVPHGKIATAPNHREILSKETEQTKPLTYQASDRKNESPPHVAASRPLTQTSSVGEDRGDHETVTDGRSEDVSQKVTSSVPELAFPGETFTRLLSRHPDLRDWLELTDYYNVEARTRRLERFRKAKALAAQRLKIEEEERRLMEEEALEMGLQRPAVTRLTSLMPTGASALQISPSLSPSFACYRCNRTFNKQGDLTEHLCEHKSPPRHTSVAEPSLAKLSQPLVTTPSTKPVPADEIIKSTEKGPAKRVHDDTGDENGEAKMPRLSIEPSRLENADKKPKDVGDARANSRPTGIGRPTSLGQSPSPSPRPRDHYRSPPRRPLDQSPPRHPRTGGFRDHDDFDNRPRRLDRYRSDGAHSLYLPRRRDSAYPVHISLGRKGGQ